MEALLEVVKDDNLWVRYHAVNLLGDLADPSTEGVLLQLLEKDEPPVQAAAATALGKCCCVESIKVLEQFSDHPDPKVMEAVHESIETLKCLL
jgi:HEAT repeat protein